MLPRCLAELSTLSTPTTTAAFENGMRVARHGHRRRSEQRLFDAAPDTAVLATAAAAALLGSSSDAAGLGRPPPRRSSKLLRGAASGASASVSGHWHSRTMAERHTVTSLASNH